MNDIVIYEDGRVELKATLKDENIWLSQKQMGELFGVDSDTVSYHLKNIYKTDELSKESTTEKISVVQKEGKRDIKRTISFYNLDAIISVGYRINSTQATRFRQWATNILKDYLIKGYTLNHEKLQKQKIDELTKTIELIKQNLKNEQLSIDEAKGFAEIVSNYAKSWALLQGYDEDSLKEKVETTKQRFILDYDEAKSAIKELKKTLMTKGEATKLFGNEKADEFKGNLLNIYQSFGGHELLPSVEQKAANLLYYVIKGHPFSDGNKRIGAYLFILFLHKNGILYRDNGEAKINDNALASLALLVATSDPSQKEIIIKLIINILTDEDE